MAFIQITVVVLYRAREHIHSREIKCMGEKPRQLRDLVYNPFYCGHVC